MPVVRAHTYAVEPADVEEFLARRASLIGTVRETQPGLTRALLLRLEDGTYCDIWHWETAAQMAAAFAAIDTFPEVAPTMALTRDATSRNGHLVDER